MAASVMSFSRIEGGANCQGQMYEIKAAAILYLRGLNSGRAFQLASNVKGAGALDDIVFRYKMADGWRTVFVQLKHKEAASRQKKGKKITIKNIKEASGIFSLTTYFKSYLEVSLTMTASNDEVPSLFDGRLEDSMFVIFTNAMASVSDGFKKVARSVNDDKEIMNYLGFGVGSVYRFDANSDQELVGMLRRQWEELSVNEAYEHREAIAQLDCDNAIKSFMERLRLFCGQPNENELDSHITVEEINAVRGCVELSSKLSRLSECFIENVQKWSEKKGCADVLHEGSDIFLRAKRKILVESVLSVNENACLLDVTFEPSVLEEWKELIEKSRLIRVESSERSSRLTCTKLVQAIGNSYMVLGLEALKDNQESVISEFQYGDHKIVIIVCNLDMEAAYLDVVQNVCDVAINCNKKIVMLSHMAGLPAEYFSPCESKTDTFKLSEIDEGSRNKFLSTKLQLQGMEVSMNQLISSSCEDADDVLSASSFVEILEGGKKMSVGKSIINPVCNYIRRTLERAITLKYSVFRGAVESMTIVNSSLDHVIRSISMQSSTSSLSSQKIEETLNRYRKVTTSSAADDEMISGGETFHVGDFECNFLHLQKGPMFEALALRFRRKVGSAAQRALLGWCIFAFKGISENHLEYLQTSQGSKHLLSFEGTELLWLKSEGQMEAIREHVDESKLILFDLDISAEVCDRLVLVCAEPGMGKTTLMSDIAVKAKTDLPFCWIIVLSLNDHTILFSENKHVDVFEFLTQAALIETEFQKAIFRYALEVTGNVVVILDAVDEIAPTYVEQSFDLMSNLLQTRARKVLVTSRNSMKSKLEDNLKTLAVRIQKFNEDEQRGYLNLSWESIRKISAEELDDFITVLLKKAYKDLSDRERQFLGTPLQLFIMAEVFEQHVTDKTKKYKLPEKLDLLKMIQEFIDKKLGVYVEKKLKIPLTDTNYKCHFKTYRNVLLETHVIAALFLLIDEESLILLHDKKIKRKATMFLKEVESSEEKTGIIDSVVNDKPRFIHRVFAEFFAANWFAENYEENEKFLKNNLYDASFGGIRTFFDRLLADQCKLHTAVLNEEIDEVHKLLKEVDVNSRDIGDRTALHLAASYVPSTDKVETARTRGILDLLIGNKPDFSLADNVLHMSPLQYADLSQSWAAIDTLLSLHSADSDNWLEKTVVNLQNKKMFNHIVVHDLERLLKFCLDEGLVVDKTEYNERDENLLMRLMQNGSHRALSLLRRKEDRSVDMIPLHHAAGRGDIVAVKRLIEYAKTTAPDLDDDAPIRDFVNAKDGDGQPALYYAALHGHADVLSLLITQGAEVEYKHDHVGILLSSAASLGHVAVIRVLLDAVSDKSAFIRACSEDGHTALIAAASGGHTSVATLLLQHLHADEKSAFITASDFGCNSALLTACYWGRHDIVRVFLEALGDAKKEAYTNLNCDDEPVYLLAALTNGHMTTVDLLLEGLNETMKSDYIRGVRKTALQAAAKEGHVDIVKRLLVTVDVDEREDLVTFRDGDGRTAIHKAASGGHVDVLHVLLEALAELGATSRADCVKARTSGGATALLLAAMKGHTKFVKHLLAAVDATEKAAYIFTNSNWGHSPLLAASNDNHPHTVEAILDALDANEKADYFANRKFCGSTDLHIASARGHVDVIKVLLNKVDSRQKIDYVRLRALSGNQQTALHLAVVSKNLNAVDALLEGIDETLRGECIDARDNLGNSVLHYATTYGTVELVKKLVDAGGRLIVTNSAGRTPLMVAAMARKLDVAVYLLSSFDPAREGATREEYLSMTDVDGKGALEWGEESFYALMGCL